MRKTFRTVICLVFVMLFVLSTLISCTNPINSDDEKVDTTKTQLYVNNFDGGVGHEWLLAVKARFEEFYKDTVFEDGKKGVQVLISNGKYRGPTLIDQIKASRDQIFITEGLYYYDYLSKGLMLDITDVITDNLTAYGENNNIENKLEDDQKNFLKSDNKYYAVPHYSGFYGINYDVDLFNEKKLYMDTAGKFNKKLTDDGLSLGVDRIPGTYDDGLPATYEEFYQLCSEMTKRGVIPVIWSGQYQFYVSCLLAAMAADANGAENTKLTFSFNGTTDRAISSVNADGTLNKTNITIGNDNAWQAFSQSGYYTALDFIYGIIKNNYYEPNSFTKGISHVDTQDTFLLSNRDVTLDPIGMLIEGNWWENEALTTFTSMESTYPNSGRMDRKFAFMPYPKPDKSYLGERTTLLEMNNSFMFINSSIDAKYVDVAKKFIAFCNTDVSLREFTVITNMPKSLKYTLTDDDMAAMSYYGKSVMQVKNSPTTDVIYQTSTNPLYYNNMSIFSIDTVFAWGDYSFPSTAFKDNAALTPKNYYEGFIRSWQNKINNIK